MEPNPGAHTGGARELAVTGKVLTVLPCHPIRTNTTMDGDPDPATTRCAIRRRSSPTRPLPESVGGPGPSAPLGGIHLDNIFMSHRPTNQYYAGFRAERDARFAVVTERTCRTRSRSFNRPVRPHIGARGNVFGSFPATRVNAAAGAGPAHASLSLVKSPDGRVYGTAA